jgi:hypothetical protein
MNMRQQRPNGIDFTNMTTDLVAILNEYNRLIEACNNDYIKQQLYILSNNFMATENQNQQQDFLENLAKVVGGAVIAKASEEIPALAEKGLEWFISLFHTNKDAIVKAAAPITTLDIHGCKENEEWNGTKCVPKVG